MVRQFVVAALVAAALLSFALAYEQEPGEAGLPALPAASSSTEEEEGEAEQEPGEAGLPALPAASSSTEEEEEEVEQEPGEAGLPALPAASSSTEEEEEEVEQEPGEAGLSDDHVSPVVLWDDEGESAEQEPGEAGLPSQLLDDISQLQFDVSAIRGMMEAAQEDEPVEAQEDESVEAEQEQLEAQDVEPVEADGSTSEIESEEAPATLDDLRLLLRFILGSMWAFAGAFIAFKIGGALL